MSQTVTPAQDALALEALVRTAFTPVYMNVADDSAHHAGHPEAHLRGGRHYKLVLVSQAFENQSRVARERLVHAALHDMWVEGRIHALSCRLYTPVEWTQKQQQA